MQFHKKSSTLISFIPLLNLFIKEFFRIHRPRFLYNIQKKVLQDEEPECVHNVSVMRRKGEKTHIVRRGPLKKRWLTLREKQSLGGAKV